MKKTKILSISLVTIFLVSGLGAIISVTANDVDDPIPIDIGPKLRSVDLPYMHQYAEKYMEKDGQSIDTSLYPTYPAVGAIKQWAILDDYLGGYYGEYFILRAIGENGELWVQMDLGYNAKKGDHRETPIVTDEQCTYLLEEFDTNIYPKDTEYFGDEEFHNGSNPGAPIDDFYDEDGKSVILVSNIRDQHYYDPDYPYYIAGFYSPTFEGFFDRNIISIDCLNWEDRVGPGVPRPFLYEAIIAHEYQHLIHDDWNTYDDTFMNEGCSMFAEPLCGYPLAWGDVDSFFFTPDNSLTDWGDQGDINILADYGSSLMWAIYLNETYGKDFLKQFVQAGIAGIDGINAALGHFGYTDTFEDAFHDWRIVNLVREGDFNYDIIDLTEHAPRIYDLDGTSSTGVDFGETITVLGYSTEIYMLGEYSTDYIRLNGLNGYTFAFDGDDCATMPTWENDGNTLYSTPAAPEMDLRILYDLDLTGIVDPMLTFDTKFEIENLWDFGFVQISDDDGLTWTSLANEYTISEYDPGAYPAIIDNLPGLCGIMDWTNMAFDLSAYSGEVILQFRYMTDWAYEEAGWWVEDVMVNDVVLDLNDFYSVIPEADFMVTLTNADGSVVVDLNINDLDETGLLALTMFGDEEILLIVSSIVGMADYKLDFYPGTAV